jgi:hypothetical protein
MERGLLWLPLLVLFIGLAWAGWNEYQKLEAYQVWAAAFDRAKYDICAMLGQKDDQLTWGKPSRQGPVNLQHLSLKDVRAIALTNGNTVIPAEQFSLIQTDGLPKQAGRTVSLQFTLAETAEIQTASIPFTELSLALQWGEFLDRQRQAYVL